MAGTIALPALLLWALFDAQPMWQQYAPMPRTDRVPPVLRAAQRLAPQAVVAVVKADGGALVRRTPADANYWLGAIRLHGHRQITGYSTYNTPASEAIEAAAGLPEQSRRFAWIRRLAYLFGGTHLIVDWRDKTALPPEAIERMIGVGSGSRLVARDAHMALIELGEVKDTAHGPVNAPGAPGPRLEGPFTVRANRPFNRIEQAVDGDPATTGAGRFPQNPGDWVDLDLGKPMCVAGIGFTPGLAVWAIPTGFVVEIKNAAGWQVVAQRRRWEVSRELVIRPITGRMIIAFGEAHTANVRIRLTEGSPWNWVVASMEVFGCSG